MLQRAHAAARGSCHLTAGHACHAGMPDALRCSVQLDDASGAPLGLGHPSLMAGPDGLPDGSMRTRSCLRQVCSVAHKLACCIRGDKNGPTCSHGAARTL